MEQYIGVFLSALDSTSLRWFNLELLGLFSTKIYAELTFCHYEQFHIS